MRRMSSVLSATCGSPLRSIQDTPATFGSVEVPTVFMGIMGVNKMTVTDSSTAKWGSQRLRVALALDNTGSIAQAGKMDALKSRPKALLSQLKAAVRDCAFGHCGTETQWRLKSICAVTLTFTGPERSSRLGGPG